MQGRAVYKDMSAGKVVYLPDVLLLHARVEGVPADGTINGLHDPAFYAKNAVKSINNH